MMELLVVFLFNMGILIFCSYGFPSFKVLKVYVTGLQFFFNSFVIYYILRPEKENVSFLDSLHFDPINKINNSKNREDIISVEYLKDRRFSLIKTKIYSKECLPNYYIKELYECPITDLILENNRTNIYKNYTEIKLINNKYLYYSNSNFSGKLYGKLYYSFSSDNIKSDENYQSRNFTKYKLNVDLLISNPLSNYIYSVKHIYLFLIFLYFNLIFYSAIESANPRIFNCFKIIRYIFEIIVLVFELLRFSLLSKIDYFLSNQENKDFIKSHTSYSSIGFEGFFLTLEIAKLIIEILHIFEIFPQKCPGYKNDDLTYYGAKYFFYNKDEDKKYMILYLSWPLYIFYILFFLFDILNTNEIERKYNYLNYNWKTHPISSIEINSNKDYEIGQIITNQNKYKLYDWKNSYFKIERLNNFDYFNIYKKENGKLCGKDSFENNLYFPEDIECPINDIIITNETNIEGYKKLPLGEKDTYLYYTNKKIDNNIIIDIRASYDYKMQLNLDKTNDLCKSLKDPDIECKEFYQVYFGEFYKNIDSWKAYHFLDKNINEKIEYNAENINLNVLTYLGINSSNIHLGGDFSDFRKNMQLFNNIKNLKKISLIINLSALIILNIFLILKNNNLFEFIVSILFLILIIGSITVYSISLYINIKYVKNFMEKINIYFHYHKNDYIFSISILIFQIIIFVTLVFITIFTYYIKKICINNSGNFVEENNTQIEVKENNTAIKQQSKEPSTDIKINQNDTDNENAPIDEQKNDESEKKRLCFYCLINKTKIILYPCLHRICCEQCYSKMKNTSDDIKICPICKSNVIKVIDKVYDI